MRWKHAGVVALLALTACSSQAARQPMPHALHTAAPTSSSVGTPDSLVGLWRVTAAAGEPSGTVLRLSAGDPFGLIIFRGCGELTGGWAASAGGSFVAMTSGWSDACSATPGKGQAPAWLLQARSYRSRGGERDLLAADGRVLAKLLPGAHPHVGADILPALRAAPTLSKAALQQLRQAPKALPAGTTAATNRSIVGRWAPAPPRGAVTTRGLYLSFSPDGNWLSKDGWDGNGGRFKVAEGGWLLLLADAFRAIACAGPSDGNLITTARRAAVAGNQLTFFDGDGNVVARFAR